MEINKEFIGKLKRYLEVKINNSIKNYDYIYLNKKMEATKSEKIDKIIVGLSYSLFGVIENQMENCINLSLPSQDIKWSCEIIRRVVSYKKI